MQEFRSWRSYWNFEQAIKHNFRYIQGPEISDFLETVLTTSQNRTETIPLGRFLWRAQLGHGWEPFIEKGEHIDDLPAPFPPDRMKPLTDRAVEGRVNPKGIPYLYLATNRETALSEVRPWIGSQISVAQFKTISELRIVNCTADKKGYSFYFKEPSPNEREKSVWRDIDRAFSKPIDRSDSSADYVPTQIIAELFKSEGFDGIAYRSSLGSGHNVALFDLEVAELINCHLFEVKAIDFEFQEVANPYFTQLNPDAKDEGNEEV